MNNSKKLDFNALADRLRNLLFAKCSRQSCEVSNYDDAIIIREGVAKMVPHTVIVLAYRFALAHNLLMYIDFETSRLVLH